MAAFLAGLFLPAMAMASSWTWWEAENPSSNNFPASTWLSPSSQADRDALSGGNLLSVSGLGPQSMYWANYNVPVAQAGTYRLYARRTYEYSPFKWQIDTGAWHYAGDQLPLLDSYGYRPYWGLNWIFLGTLTLDTGPHVVRIVLSGADWPGNSAYSSGTGAAAFDAFVLTADPNYIPRGKLQPGQQFGLAEPGKWNFEPGQDDFTPAALVDLRSLNEAVAGQSGYVHRAADGSGRLVLGDGSPVRFWGAFLGNGGLDLGSLTTQARFLAKRGVNLVRYLDRLPACDPANINAVNASVIDNAQRIVAACKQAGIYTQLNYYWSPAFTLRGAWGVPGYTNDVAGPGPVLMFDDTLKAAYKQWVTQMFTATNPYTGIPLAQDPALAVIEIQNEDNFLWWWDPNGLPKPQLQSLETKFGAYLIAKYGSIAAAQANWAPWDTLADDDPAHGRMGLLSAYFMTTQQYADWSRAPDEIGFLADLQHAFYQEMGDFLRNTLGCRSLIESGNWYTVEDRYLLDVEHYTYTPNDVVDEHIYFEGPHLDQAFYGVNVGDYYQSISAVSNPRQLPCAYKQVAGYLNMASETSWVNPNRFKAEGPLLIAAYNSLADIDAWIWFSTSTLAYDDSENKWPLALPSVMGQFPGAALLYRRGDVQTQLAVHEERNLTRAYQKQVPLISQSVSTPNDAPPYIPPYDPITRTGRLDPLAMLTGRVECHYVFQDGSNFVAPNVLSQIDTASQVVESLPPTGATRGELKLDWSNSVFQVNTPRSQGICGFLNHFPSVDLNDVTIASSNDFGAVLVIALDDLPIAQSHRILIQAMTEDNPYGWQDQDQVFTNSVDGLVYTGKKVLSVGQPPMNVVNIAGAVTFKGLAQDRSFRTVVLDENGYIKDDASSQALGTNLQVTLPANALYTVLLDLAQFTPPSIISQPQSQVVDPGTNVEFSASATGSPPLTYQWLHGGLPLAGATSSTLVLSNVTAAGSGDYSMSAVNWAGSVTSAVAVLTVKAPPVIGQQPQNAAANPGSNVTFTVTAGGTGRLSYQWLLDGTALAGATASSLVLTNVQSTDQGNYSVIVSNQFGTTVSSNALLLVGYPQADIGNPAHHGSAQLSFDAAGQEVITVNGGGSDMWNTSDSFHFYYNTRTGPFDCRVRVRNFTGPDWWSKLELIARESTGAGARFFGNMATLLSGQNQVWVQWRDTTGGQAASPTAPTPTINPNYPDCWLRLQRVGNVFYASYSPDGTNWNRYYTWNTASLSAGAFAQKLLVGLAVTAHNNTDTSGATAVCSDFQFDPMISAQPRSATVLAGDQVALKVTASGASALSYQWWFNSARLVGATNVTLTLTNVQPAQAGTYYVVVSDAAGSETSANAVLTVNVPPMITLQPQSRTVAVGTTVTFNSTASGSSPLSFQWQFNGTNLTDGGSIMGSQTSSLTLNSVVMGNAGSYSVVVTNAFASVTSTAAALTVLPATPVVTWPGPAPITYGAALGDLQLNAAANVPGTFAYSPPAGSVLGAGTNPLSVVFTPNDTLDYNTTTASVSVVVLKAPLTVTANNATRTYGNPNPGFTGTVAGLVNGDSISATYTCTATPASLPGTYSIVPALVDSTNQQANYNVALVNGTLTVNPAAAPTLISLTPNIGLTNGGDTVILAGAGFESGATVTFGTNIASSVEFISSTNLSVLTPPSVPGTVDIVVTNADRQIARLTNGFTYGEKPYIAAPPTNQTVVFGAGVEFRVLAGGTEPLSCQWQHNAVDLADAGVITGSQSNLLTIASVSMGDAGSYAVLVTNAFGSVTSAVATLTVLPATPVVNWSNPAPIIYGTALSHLQLDATVSLPGIFGFSPPPGTVLDVGTNLLSVVFRPNDTLDYNTCTASVSLVVLGAPLTVTADSATRTYGDPNPSFTGTIAGLVNGDSISATYTCAATQTSLPGSYSIVPALVDPNNQRVNYNVTLVAGTLTVTPAAPPTLISVTPNLGLTNGGDTVSIVGTGFESGATVTFGTNAASTVEFVNSTNLTALTPASVPGTMDLVVTNADGQVATLTNGFTYLAPPTLQAATISDGVVTLTWSAEAGQTYQVQYKTDLRQPDWANLTMVTATNSSVGVSDDLNSAPQRFYRTIWLH